MSSAEARVVEQAVAWVGARHLMAVAPLTDAAEAVVRRIAVGERTELSQRGLTKLPDLNRQFRSMVGRPDQADQESEIAWS